MAEEEDGIGMWSLPPPTNTSKIHLHVEKLSWKLAKEHLYNQSSKKDSHVTRYDGEKAKGQDLCH